jgi:asparagine synthase (glutamine-hydrolysing)
MVMAEAMRHRGPDDSGVTRVSREPDVAIGQSRLSIIDVSPDGHQPMCDPDTGNVIVFNGEIYNFKLLRDELCQKGQISRTQSDTEVILKAYAVWGMACPVRLRGVFT